MENWKENYFSGIIIIIYKYVYIVIVVQVSLAPRCPLLSFSASSLPLFYLFRSSFVDGPHLNFAKALFLEQILAYTHNSALIRFDCFSVVDGPVSFNARLAEFRRKSLSMWKAPDIGSLSFVSPHSKERESEEDEKSYYYYWIVCHT